MQKISKTIMHLWITIVSLGAFIFSWLLLVHSPKPAPLAVLKPLIAQSSSVSTTRLQPIPSLNDLLTSGSSRQVQTFQQNTNTFQSQPRLRTHGS
jgi:hypothetical protein